MTLMGLTAQILLDAGLILIPTGLLLYKHKGEKGKLKSIAEETGLKSNGFKDLKNTFCLLAALIAVSMALVGLFSLLGWNDLHQVEQVISSLSPAMIVYLVTVRVFSEEYFFRGFLVKKVGKLSSSIVFGLAHYSYGSITEVIGAFILGFLLAYAYEKYGNLLPNIASHVIYNTMAVQGVI